MISNKPVVTATLEWLGSRPVAKALGAESWTTYTFGIGIFASSITNNQIVAFILGALFCFFIHFGFEFIYSFGIFGGAGGFIKSLGIEHHYQAISKGVVDSRDIIYFITTTFIFLFATKIFAKSKKNKTLYGFMLKIRKIIKKFMK